MQEHEPLTEREWEVAVLAAESLPNKQIAAATGLSQATVKGYLETIYHKLGIHSRVELARWVWERQEGAGWLPPFGGGRRAGLWVVLAPGQYGPARS